jgi:uncharacterized protein YkwD
VPAARHLITAALAAAMLVVPAAAHAKATPKKHKGPTATVALGDKRPPRARAAQECANANLMPTADNLDAVRAAVLCLHNQIRASKGLPTLHDNAKLRKAAAGHSDDMVTEGYFDHTAPDGDTFVDRILSARYAKQTDGWSLGENLAWGTGSFATPRGAVQAWMESPGHKANILKRSYREMGVGVVLGVPVSDAAGATYTVDFGVRR